MRDQEFYKQYRDKNIQLTRKKIRESVMDDNLIIQSIHNLEDVDKAINLLSKRLREWYGLKNPEFVRETTDNEALARQIIEARIGKKRNSMGADLNPVDDRPMEELAKRIAKLFDLRKSHETYIEKKMMELCPNITTVSGSLVGAKLLAQAGSLKKLSLFTASTIQLLGAEKALFRHMKTGAKAPKHGIILQHPMLQHAKREDRGKVARALADKISIAAKVDYFKGKFVGNRLKKELTDRFGK